MLRGFIIFFIQSIALSCFFAFFFEGKKKLLTIACMLCVFNLILLPIALLISNSYLIIPINLFIIYLTLRLLFPKESKLYCFFSVILYTVTSLAADIFTFFLFFVFRLGTSSGHNRVFLSYHFLCHLLYHVDFIFRLHHSLFWTSSSPSPPHHVMANISDDHPDSFFSISFFWILPAESIDYNNIFCSIFYHDDNRTEYRLL